jgi:hypothetical protein
VLIPIIHKSEKPVLIALLGSELTKEAAKHFQRADIPTYTFPEKAASALGILVRRAEYSVLVSSNWNKLNTCRICHCERGEAVSCQMRGIVSAKNASQ